MQRPPVSDKRRLTARNFLVDPWEECGLSIGILSEAMLSTYETLDAIDSILLDKGMSRLSGLVELANLSAMVGNLFAAAIVHVSNGAFTRAGPHKYQDLRASTPGSPHIEIKVALENNKPKGHLAKAGHYLTCRYVLADVAKNFVRGKENRGDMVWVWEVRFGYLEERHFTISNTAGDSGKTAVVSAEGMTRLRCLYVDRDISPVRLRGRQLPGE